MGGTGKRNLAIAEAIGVGRSAFDERQCLHGLAGRTRKHLCLNIAKRKNQFAITVDNGGKTPVNAFNAIAAGDFDGNGVLHGSLAHLLLSSSRNGEWF